jgi:acyl dehydratase
VPLDPSFVGRAYPSGEPYRVSREKIREFADAIGDDNPLYRDPETARRAGYADVIAPPTFLTVVNGQAIDALAADPDLGLDYARMVHGDQSFAHHRPVTAGEKVIVTTHVHDIVARAGNDFLTVRAEIATDGGEPLCTAMARLVIRGAES